MAKRPQTAGKRQREQAKLEKRQRKQEKKAAAAAERQEQPTTAATDPEAESTLSEEIR